VSEIAARLEDLVSRARSNRLKPEDMTAGGFTITNVGMTGTLMAFPLLNPGQPGILAPGAIRDGHCYVTLCYDRRAMDDYAADRLLARVTEELEKL
jgi:pyruvate/2-oxoglutarate dehydrogenase complex dihydrolipoamide acyltransferase (E2) component